MATLFQEQPIQRGSGTQKAQDFSPSSGVGDSSGAGDSLTQITSGPAALAQLMIYEVMALYAQIVHLQSEQKQEETKAQVAMNQEQAKATKQAGAVMGKALEMGAIFTMAGAGLSLLGFAAHAGYDKWSSRGLGAQEKEIDQTLGPMEQMEKSFPLEGADGSIGNGIPNNPKPEDQEVNARVQEFKEGNYQNAKAGDTTRNAIKQWKSEDLEGYNNAQEKIHQKMDRLTREKNNIGLRRSTNQQTVLQGTQLLHTAGQTISQFKQGEGTAGQAKENAIATLNQTSSQMAGSTAGDLGQAMTKAYDAQNQEVQILERIHQTNSVNG